MTVALPLRRNPLGRCCRRRCCGRRRRIRGRVVADSAGCGAGVAAAAPGLHSSGDLQSVHCRAPMAHVVSFFGQDLQLPLQHPSGATVARGQIANG